ncbi:hypothetical protein PRUPE_4G254400 [Prunus persica]|uniref:Uncharacterized protein n=1 Tax=Prunus persica TaxID=3760 RepID=A0A251PQX7_PRUPE|nr:hypothetical protein PRUPE_4G254400 [Prunus persica]
MLSDGKELEMGGCNALIVESLMPYDQEFYLSIVFERLGSTVSLSSVEVLKLTKGVGEKRN